MLKAGTAPLDFSAWSDFRGLYPNFRCQLESTASDKIFQPMDSLPTIPLRVLYPLDLACHDFQVGSPGPPYSFRCQNLIFCFYSLIYSEIWVKFLFWLNEPRCRRRKPHSFSWCRLIDRLNAITGRDLRKARPITNLGNPNNIKC